MNSAAQLSPENVGQVAAGCVYFALAPLMISAAPVFLGLLSERYGLSPPQIGALAAVEASGGLLASVTGPYWIDRLPWRQTAFAATLVLVAGAAATLFADSFGALFIIRLLASVLGGGPLYAISIALLSRTRSPDRHFAVAGGIQAIVPAAVMLIVPFGSNFGGAPLAIAVFVFVMALGLVVAPWLPKTRLTRSSVEAALREVRSGARKWPPRLLLLSALSLTATTGAYWSFAERIGVSGGLSPQSVGAVLAAASVVGLAGSVGAAWLSGRIAREALFLFGAIGYLSAFVIASLDTTILTYSASMFLLYVFSVFLTPLQLGALAEVDATGGAVMLAPAAQSLGVMAGPLASGAVIRGADFSGCVMVAVAFLVVTWAAFEAARRSHRVQVPGGVAHVE